MTFSDFVSVLALCCSLYAIWMTHRFNKRQLPTIETQEQLNRLELRRRDQERLDALKADVDANLISIGSNNYRLKVFNKGKAQARNVTIEFIDGNEIIVKSELLDKLPIEILNPQRKVEFIAFRNNSSRAKHKIVIRWDDEFSVCRENKVNLTF